MNDKKYVYDFVLDLGHPHGETRERFEFDEEPDEKDLNEAINEWVLNQLSFYWEEQR